MKLDGVPMEWLHKVHFMRTVPTLFQEGHAPVLVSAVGVITAALRNGWLTGSSLDDTILTGLLEVKEAGFGDKLSGYISSSQRLVRDVEDVAFPARFCQQDAGASRRAWPSPVGPPHAPLRRVQLLQQLFRVRLQPLRDAGAYLRRPLC